MIPSPGLRDRRAIAAGALLLGAGALLLLHTFGSGHRLRVQAPEPLGDLPDLALEARPSVFSVPVEVALEPLVDVVDRAIPRTFGDLEDRQDIPGQSHLSAAYQVERSPIGATFSDSTATLAATLAYRARAWYDPPILPAVSASCGTGDGEPAPRLAVALVTPLTLDRDWRLRSRIRAGRMAPVTDTDRDRCRVTPLRFDMTDRVIEAAREVVEQFGPTADSAIAALDVRESFAEWWETIAEPIRLAEDVWLVLGPEAVGRGAIRGDGSTIRTTLTLRARPRVVVAEVRPTLDSIPLPPLEEIAPEDELHIFADALADYDEVAELVMAEVSGMDLQAGNRSLEVVGLAIEGVGDGRISLRVKVTGDARGDLYLVGTPFFDPATDQVTVPDLDFDVATREALVSGAAWVVRLGLVDTLREHARWPTGEAADWARRQVETGFNSRLSDDVRLEGSVDTVAVRGVVAGRTALRVRAEVRGRARLVVGGGD